MIIFNHIKFYLLFARPILFISALYLLASSARLICSLSARLICSPHLRDETMSQLVLSTSHISCPHSVGLLIFASLLFPSPMLVTSPLMYSPRFKYLYPSTVMSVWWQKYSVLSDPLANPYPFFLLNHFTWYILFIYYFAFISVFLRNLLESCPWGRV